MTEPAAPAIAAPDDWVAAAKDHRVRFPRSEFGQHERRQLGRALAYLAARDAAVTADEVTVCRAARILRAEMGAPDGECRLGVRDTDVDVPELPEDARELLERLGADIPVPVIEPTAVTTPAKGRAKAAAKDGAGEA